MKYNEKDTLRIKNEIKILGAELLSLNKEKQKEKDEIDSIKVDIIKKRKELEFLGKEIEKDFSGKKNNLDSYLKSRSAGLISEISVLEKEKISLSDSLQLAKSIISKLKISNECLVEENNKLKKEVSDIDFLLDRKKEVASQEIEKINHETCLVNNRVIDLKDQEKEVLSRIALIRDEFESNLEKNRKLQSSLEKSRIELEQIKRREHDVIVREKRLAPEYQAVFNRLRKRK